MHILLRAPRRFGVRGIDMGWVPIPVPAVVGQGKGKGRAGELDAIVDGGDNDDDCRHDAFCGGCRGASQCTSGRIQLPVGGTKFGEGNKTQTRTQTQRRGGKIHGQLTPLRVYISPARTATDTASTNANANTNHDGDDGLEEYRRTSSIRRQERRQFDRWQRRLNIARQFHAQDVFAESLPEAVRYEVTERRRPPPAAPETREERKAWGALDRARDVVDRKRHV